MNDYECLPKSEMNYCHTSNTKCTLVGNTIVDHSNEIRAPLVCAASTTSSFSTLHLAPMDWAKTNARWDEKHLLPSTSCSDGNWVNLVLNFLLVRCLQTPRSILWVHLKKRKQIIIEATKWITCLFSTYKRHHNWPITGNANFIPHFI